MVKCINNNNKKKNNKKNITTVKKATKNLQQIKSHLFIHIQLLICCWAIIDRQTDNIEYTIIITAQFKIK